MIRRRTSGPQTPTSSLRLRVVVGVLALLLVVLVALGAIVNGVLGDRLRSDLRQRLTDRAGLAQALGTRSQGLSDQQLANRLIGQGINASVNQVPGVENPSQGLPPRPPQGRPGKAAALPTGITTRQTGELLRSSFTVDGRQVVLSTSLADVDHALRTLRSVELVAGGATLVVVGLGLIWVVGAALSPLTRMTNLARRIRDGARGGRLRPTRPNTELGRTALAFDDMLDSLEAAEFQARAAEERMRQFLADASHDLRTPVAGVIASAERILREDPDRRGREAQLLTLIREARRASRLVDDVVLMSRLDAAADAPARRQPVDLTAAARTVAERRAVTGGHAAVRVETAGPVVVDGDPDRLDRLVTNLVDNASRHGRTADVVVTVGRDGDRAVLHVSDDGPGVPPADRERIFDRFVRLEEHRAGPGSGLGLPIAQGIAHAHGGRVECVDRPDGRPGACFLVTLPARRVDVSTPTTVQLSSASRSSDNSFRMSPA